MRHPSATVAEVPRARRPARTAARVLRGLAVPVVLAVVATAAAPGLLHIRVRRGDTLWGIARAHHTTVQTLRRLNHIPAGSDLIRAGQLLALPGNGAAQLSTGTRTVHYVVRRGDTVTAIAHRFGVPVRAVLSRNHLGASGLIVPGERLAIGVHAASAGSTRAASGGTSAARHDRAVLAGRPVPSRDDARRLIESTARSYGVDPALALGVAYMESGFNQRVVSSVGAVGVMQVLPSTGRWIGDDVLHEHLDMLDARDNVRAGVMLLRLLTRAAPTRTAVAAYYQGLASVRAHGMYADTRRYVADVLALRHRFGG